MVNPYGFAEYRENYSGNYIKKENDGNCLGNLFVISFNYRCSGSYGGASADGGAYTYEGSRIGFDFKELMQEICRNQ